MFDFIKQMNQLRQLQSALENEQGEGEAAGVRVVVNGKMHVQSVSVPPGLAGQELETAVRDATNQAIDNIQRAIAAKFSAQQLQ